MSWWSRHREERDQSHLAVAAARQALSVTINERSEAKELKKNAERTSEEFAARALSIREIRQRNHITPSLFPPPKGLS